ncbi:unnamed protein product [Trichobilharzia regenti]|nr:unnamed protein product [Trichobilharzia regenti]
MKIYTRTGDNGTSSLLTGERRPKNNTVFHALGTIDELSCCLGLASAHIDNHLILVKQLPQYDVSIILQHLEHIQSRLQALSSAIATPLYHSHEEGIVLPRSKRYEYVNFPESIVSSELEQWIDQLTEALPPLKQFILPSGGTPGCSLHYARAVCRRAERFVIHMNFEREYPSVEDSVIKYLNRLSDYLFVASRYITHGLGYAEKPCHLPHKQSDESTTKS